ncbi:MAG: hypothetical protein K8R87_10225 [Verrucomicrobia bacterium]|nr:hypothetical protein [Verrucomicrobiota bacterium]
MKKIVLSILTTAFFAGIIQAKQMHFPEKGDAMFTITIPDAWEPEKDDDNILEATSPDEHIYLAVWELESKKDLKNLGNDIENLLKDHAKNIKLDGEPVEAKPGGMDGLLFKGHAKDKEDDSKIEFFALLIITEEKAAVLYIEAAEDTPEEESAKLEKILKSIKPAKE